MNTLNERNKALNITYAQIIRNSLKYIKQIKEFEEEKRKSLSMIAQGNDKLEKMVFMRKDHGGMRGLRFNSNVNRPASTQRAKNVFVKTKGKAKAQASHKGKEKVSSQGPFRRFNGVEWKEKSLFKGKAPLKQGEVLRRPKSQPYSYAKAAWNSFQTNKTSSYRGYQENASTSRKPKGQARRTP